MLNVHLLLFPFLSMQAGYLFHFNRVHCINHIQDLGH